MKEYKTYVDHTHFLPNSMLKSPMGKGHSNSVKTQQLDLYYMDKKVPPRFVPDTMSSMSFPTLMDFKDNGGKITIATDPDTTMKYRSQNRTHVESTMFESRSNDLSRTPHHMFESTLQSKGDIINKSALINNTRLIKMMNSDLELRNHESIDKTGKHLRSQLSSLQNFDQSGLQTNYNSNARGSVISGFNKHIESRIVL